MAIPVQPPELAFEINAPDLRILVTEFQRTEWNPDLGGPPGFRDAGLDVPDTVPVRVVVPPLTGHLGIPLGTSGIGRELISVPSVVEGVEDDSKAVAAPGVVVLLEVADDDFRGLHVVGKHTEIERILCIENANVRVVGRRIAFARLVLDETVGHRRFPPRRFLERPVEHDRAWGANGGDPLSQVNRVVVDGVRTRSGRCRRPVWTACRWNCG